MDKLLIDKDLFKLVDFDFFLKQSVSISFESLLLLFVLNTIYFGFIFTVEY